MIQIKRVYDPSTKEAGARFLTERLCKRAIPACEDGRTPDQMGLEHNCSRQERIRNYRDFNAHPNVNVTII